METTVYVPKNKVRVVTAASLFDGHDAAINVMRRIVQSTGCEVIHLGHDRSVQEVVETAIQEDANAIAMTSYQGGHNEYFKYMYDLLKERVRDRKKWVFEIAGLLHCSATTIYKKTGEEHFYSVDEMLQLIRHYSIDANRLFENPTVLQALFGVQVPTLETVFEGLANYIDQHFHPGTLDALLD